MRYLGRSRAVVLQKNKHCVIPLPPQYVESKLSGSWSSVVFDIWTDENSRGLFLSPVGDKELFGAEVYNDEGTGRGDGKPHERTIPEATFGAMGKRKLVVLSESDFDERVPGKERDHN